MESVSAKPPLLLTVVETPWKLNRGSVRPLLPKSTVPLAPGLPKMTSFVAGGTAPLLQLDAMPQSVFVPPTHEGSAAKTSAAITKRPAFVVLVDDMVAAPAEALQ